MNIGYVRVSTLEQNEERQLDMLKGCNLEKIFIENESITALPGDIVVINRERVHTLTGNNFVHHCLIPSDSIFEWLAKASK